MDVTFHWSYWVTQVGGWHDGDTPWACSTLWLLWEMLHMGNYSWQPFSKAHGTAHICDWMGRSHVALPALQHHSCGESKPLQPLISGYSHLRNNNKLLTLCLYGTWFLWVLLSGLGTGTDSPDVRLLKYLSAGVWRWFCLQMPFFFFSFALSFPSSNREVCFP